MWAWLGLGLGLDTWTDFQDAQLVKFAMFVFAALMCDWLSFSPAHNPKPNHTHIMLVWVLATIAR